MPLDPRIVQIGIEVSGQIKYYEGLNIQASGTKYANSTENECTVIISNLSKETRDYILTETSPFIQSPDPKRLIVKAGRESTGPALIFVGDVISATPTQPPDISLTIKAKTGNTQKGNVVSVQYPDTVNLSQIAKDVADTLGVTLSFEATDKKVANYSFTGGNLKNINQIGYIGGVDVFLDDDSLVVKDKNKPIREGVKLITLDSGMVGIPEITEHGVRVTFLLDPGVKIGSEIQCKSKINPAVDGNYEIFRLSFDIASRDRSFYYIAEAKRL